MNEILTFSQCSSLRCIVPRSVCRQRCCSDRRETGSPVVVSCICERPIAQPHPPVFLQHATVLTLTRQQNFQMQPKYDHHDSLSLEVLQCISLLVSATSCEGIVSPSASSRLAKSYMWHHVTALIIWSHNQVRAGLRPAGVASLPEVRSAVPSALSQPAVLRHSHYSCR